MGAAKLKLFNAIDFLVRVQKGPDKGKAYKINPPKITIGRDPKTCQIALTDPRVSRQQLVIQFGETITLKDLSSRKTTMVNGKSVMKAAISPGDIISFGDTELVFMTRANDEATKALPGMAAPTPKANNKQAARNRFMMFGVVIALMVGALFVLDEGEVTATRQRLITQDDVNKQIEESKERAEQIRENAAERKKIGQKRYLINVESHFISGFRDFQNGQYNRALESFGTTMATDQEHQRAQLYAQTARKRKTDLIDTHLRDGTKYKEKLMYDRCAAEFEKALVLISNKNSKKYSLAKTQMDECRLLQRGGKL